MVEDLGCASKVVGQNGQMWEGAVRRWRAVRREEQFVGSAGDARMSAVQLSADASCQWERQTMVFVVCQMTADRVSRNDIFTLETDDTMNGLYVGEYTITKLSGKGTNVIFGSGSHYLGK
jgi:hypothetical protein